MKLAAFAVRGLLRVRRVHERTALRAMSCAMNCEPDCAIHKCISFRETFDDDEERYTHTLLQNVSTNEWILPHAHGSP